MRCFSLGLLEHTLGSKLCSLKSHFSLELESLLGCVGLGELGLTVSLSLSKDTLCLFLCTSLGLRLNSLSLDNTN